jgi:exopolysaccharide production protein ExoZ
MKLGSIQMLRALAAILVVYTHSICAMDSFAYGWQQNTPVRTSLGTFGVDIFFVISGFVIYRSAGQLTGQRAALSFLWHRFRRINPVCYAATLLTLLVWLPGFLRHDQHDITSQKILSSIILLHYPGWTYPILFQTWTLSFEWYFYGIFCLLILIGTQKKVTALTIILSGSIGLGWLLLHHDIGVGSFYTNPYLFEFLLGVIIGYCYNRWTPGKGIAWGLLLPGIVLGLIWIATGSFDIVGRAELQHPHFQRWHAFGWGSSAALIVAGCTFLEKLGTSTFLYRHRLILLLGDASYSIYLFHMIPLGVMASVYIRFGIFLPADAAIVLDAILAVAGSLLFYKWVEKPLLKIMPKPRYTRTIPSRTAAP